MSQFTALKFVYASGLFFSPSYIFLRLRDQGYLLRPMVVSSSLAFPEPVKKLLSDVSSEGVYITAWHVQISHVQFKIWGSSQRLVIAVSK